LAELLRKGFDDTSSTPNARRPFQVKAKVTHLESGEADPTDFPVLTLSIRPLTRPVPQQTSETSEFVSSRECGRARQQEVLDIVDFQHGNSRQPANSG